VAALPQAVVSFSRVRQLLLAECSHEIRASLTLEQGIRPARAETGFPRPTGGRPAVDGFPATRGTLAAAAAHSGELRRGTSPGRACGNYQGAEQALAGDLLCRLRGIAVMARPVMRVVFESAPGSG
jgi:hypothetical protein